MYPPGGGASAAQAQAQQQIQQQQQQLHRQSLPQPVQSAQANVVTSATTTTATITTQRHSSLPQPTTQHSQSVPVMTTTMVPQNIIAGPKAGANNAGMPVGGAQVSRQQQQQNVCLPLAPFLCIRNTLRKLWAWVLEAPHGVCFPFDDCIHRHAPSHPHPHNRCNPHARTHKHTRAHTRTSSHTHAHPTHPQVAQQLHSQSQPSVYATQAHAIASAPQQQPQQQQQQGGMLRAPAQVWLCWFWLA